MIIPTFSRRFFWFLVILGFAMTFGALRIDLHDFVETPLYLWIFVPVCSLYPLLLALNYLLFLKRGYFSQFLLQFTLFGIIGYGIIAPFFYAYYMYENGFAWYEFGNIFWVWLYASQAFLLWKYVKKIPWWQFSFIILYFFTKDFLDRFSVTWSYVRFEVLSLNMMNVIFGLLLIVHVGISLVLARKVFHIGENVR